MHKRKIIYILIAVLLLSNSIFFGFSDTIKVKKQKKSYTVDDVRDIIGQERNDGKFSANEIEEIIQKYKAIEKKNLYAKMFQLGKEIDIDSETERLHNEYQKEIEELKILLEKSYKQGLPLNEILKIKTKLENKIHEKSKLKQKGVEFNFDFVENKWSEKYEAVQKNINEMEKDYEIGALGGNLRSPVYTGFKITSPFGFRLDPFTHDKLEMHDGIDLRGTLGTPVLSLWNGVVSNVYVAEKGGKTIEISHGKDLKTYYSHLSAFNVTIGEEVRQYQIIGEVGSTGRSTSPHLDLKMKLDGVYVNPLYVFGKTGLNAFKEYLSYNPNRNRELDEFEKKVKNQPDKIRTIQEVSISQYHKESELKEGQKKVYITKNIEPTPYLDYNHGLLGEREELIKYIEEILKKEGEEMEEVIQEE